MNAIIVTIGDELLIGQVVDTNAAWIGTKLTAAGIEVKEMVSISDSPEHIVSTLDRLIGSTDVVVMTGGLGPTKDDLTKETLVRYFNGKLVMNEEVLKKIEDFFKSRGRTIIDSNRSQALLPDNCIILPNEHGTAQGMWFTKKNTHVISMPGVPYEMKPLTENHLIPRLLKIFNVPSLMHKTIMTQGVPESYLADMINEWEEALPSCMKLAYLPRPGIVRLRLTVTGKCVAEGELLLKEHIDKLLTIIPEHIFGYDDLAIEQALGELLKEKGLLLATAESCTGGNIAKMVTSVPGSSEYFKGSLIAYSNEIKVNELGVSQENLDKYGSVSQEVIEEMALGILNRFKADISVATSGVAGPGGGSDEKPVGTVWIAVAMKDRVYSKLYLFGGNRNRNIEQSSIMAISLLRKLILGII